MTFCDAIAKALFKNREYSLNIQASSVLLSQSCLISAGGFGKRDNLTFPLLQHILINSSTHSKAPQYLHSLRGVFEADNLLPTEFCSII